MTQVGCAYGTLVWWPQHINHYPEQKCDNIKLKWPSWETAFGYV